MSSAREETLSFQSTKKSSPVKSLQSVQGGGAPKKLSMKQQRVWALVGVIALVLAIGGLTTWLILRGRRTLLQVDSQGGNCRQACSTNHRTCNGGAAGTRIVFNGVPVVSYLGNTQIARGSTVPVGTGLVLATVSKSAQGHWTADSFLLYNAVLGGDTMAAVLQATLASPAGKIVKAAPGAVPPSSTAPSSVWKAFALAVVGDGALALSSPALQKLLASYGASKMGSVKPSSPYVLLVDVVHKKVLAEQTGNPSCAVTATATVPA